MTRTAALVRQGAAMEAAGWASLARWLARRPRVSPGGHAAPYVGPVRTVLVVFLALSAVEVVVVDLVVQRWPVVRVVLLVLGVWGVTFMAGLLAGMVVNPHEVGRAGFRLRSGPRVDLRVPWDPVDTVAVRRRAHPSGPSVQVADEDGATVVSLPVQDTTNLEVRLVEPVVLATADGPVAADVVRFWADDPAAALAAARRLLRERKDGPGPG